MAQTIRLGELLLKAGVIQPQDLERALAEQRRWGGRLGTTLVRMGVLTEDLLVKALARQLGLPRANLEAIQVPAQLLARIDRAECERQVLVPLAYVQDKKTLLVAVADPSNVVAMDDLGRRVGLKVEPYLAGETAIRAALTRLFAAGGAAAVPEETGLRLVNNQGESMRDQPPQASGFPRGRIPTHLDQHAVDVSDPDPRVSQLDELARRQTRALQVVVELLIEKGVISREEYLAWLRQR